MKEGPVSNRRKWVFAIALTAIVATLVVRYRSYNTREFTGGLYMRDDGAFAYPRYRAEIGYIPLREPGEYTFNVSGLPQASMDFALQVPNATQTDRDRLTSLSTSVGILIMGPSRATLCQMEGQLADAKKRGPSSWVLSSSASHAEFWTPRCQEIRTHPLGTYTVRVTVSGTDARAPERLLAVLKGGGNELP